MIIESFSELVYVYITLAIAAPLLVGIVTPLISSVISRIEEKRFEHFQELKEKTKKLSKAKDPEEYERIKQEREEAEQKYEDIKGKAGGLWYSVILGGSVTLLGSVGILNLFGAFTVVGEFASDTGYLFLTIFLFLVEVIIILGLVAYYVKSEREAATKKLSTKSSR